jgi:hypothetical protein
MRSPPPCGRRSNGRELSNWRRNYAGDLIVSGEITHFERGEVSFLPVDVVTARDYKVSFTARVVARDRITGRVVLEREMTGKHFDAGGRRPAERGTPDACPCWPPIWPGKSPPHWPTELGSTPA